MAITLNIAYRLLFHYSHIGDTGAIVATFFRLVNISQCEFLKVSAMHVPLSFDRKIK